MAQAIGVYRNPVHPAHKKVYSPFTRADGSFSHRYYNPTPRSRDRIARLVMSKIYDVYVDKRYFVIIRKIDSAAALGEVKST